MARSGRATRSDWRRPRRARVRAIRDRLRELYGRPVNNPHGHPIAELVRTVLSQNTNDRNRDVAYERLRAALADLGARFATRRSPRSRRRSARAGCRRPKAPRIQEILRRLPEVDGDPTSTGSPTRERDEALEFLIALPGVGRKTAACVMIFTFDRPEIPVDTHVYRVGGRLGLFRERASFEAAHDEMLAITDPEDAYELHVNLITHGRRVCRPHAPLRAMRPAAHVPVVPGARGQPA